MTEDTFFVNSWLLARKLSEESTSDDEILVTNRMNSILERTTLILLDEPPKELQALPESLRSLLAYLREKLPLSPKEFLHQSTPSLPEVILLPSAESNPHVQ
ncbi:hypothetical protein FRC09_006872, partial [Ceratobasidium sp. 395]